MYRYKVTHAVLLSLLIPKPMLMKFFIVMINEIYVQSALALFSSTSERAREP